MPKSQRQRVVALTNVKKKGKALKEKLVQQIQESFQNFQRIMVFSCENMRNTQLKTVREDLKPSRMFLGKNKVMIYALTSLIDESDPKSKNLPALTEHIRGNCGLLFTNEKPDTIIEKLGECRVPHFARSGFIATQDFTLNQGPLPEVPFSMEPLFRKLGLPTRLDKGIVELMGDVAVCKVGDTLSPEQCKILQHFGVMMAEFRVLVHCVFENGKLTEYEPHPENAGEEDGSDGEDDDEEGAAASSAMVDDVPAQKPKAVAGKKRKPSTKLSVPAEETPAPVAAAAAASPAKAAASPAKAASPAPAATPAAKKARARRTSEIAPVPLEPETPGPRRSRRLSNTPAPVATPAPAPAPASAKKAKAPASSKKGKKGKASNEDVDMFSGGFVEE